MTDKIAARRNRHRLKRLAHREAQYANKRVGREERTGNGEVEQGRFTTRPR